VAKKTLKKKPAPARRPKPRALPPATNSEPARQAMSLAERALDTAAMIREFAHPTAPAPAPPAAHRVLTEEVDLHAFGLQPLEITPEQEAILSEPVNPEDVRVLPDRNGTIYLSHPTYTKWLNRAFGRGQWQLVQVALAKINEANEVIVPYVLFVKGKAIAFANGQQEWHGGEDRENQNKAQSMGDALEATKAYALRRCCKNLGIGLELWDKLWADQFLQDYCVKVPVEIKRGNDTRTAYQWRLKRAPKFWNEKRAGTVREEGDHEPPREQRSVASHQHGDAKITEKQAGRLFGILRSVGRTQDEIKEYLWVKYGIRTSRDIKRDDYENICAAIEHPGPLIKPTATYGNGDIIDTEPVREPGEEG
jgi:hypothetical protein